jgi:5-formyltetrahydrofolate cyclo-ligase
MPTGELSTTAIVEDALKNHKQVFVPYIHNIETTTTHQKTSIMDMLALDSMEEFMSLERDKWGIPSLTQAQASSKQNCFGGKGLSAAVAKDIANSSGLDLIVMPGMAFDPVFRRLGHGKGYYDSFLTRYLRWEAESGTDTRNIPLLGKVPSYLRCRRAIKFADYITVALSLKEQTLSPPEEIPVTNHDWPVDILVVGDDRCLVRQR